MDCSNPRQLGLDVYFVFPMVMLVTSLYYSLGITTPLGEYSITS